MLPLILTDRRCRIKQPRRHLRPQIVAGIVGVSLLTTAFATSRAIHYRSVNKSYEEMRNTLFIEFPQDTVVEYGEPFDVLADVQHSGSEIFTSGSVDTSKVGTVSVTYVVTGNEVNYGMTASKRAERFVQVIDSKPPVIELESDRVDIEAGEDYDPASNVSSVKDPVDGDIPYSEEPIEGSYTINIDGDLGEAGDHTATVSARDINGNTDEKTFTITVTEAAEPAPEPEPVAAAASEPVQYRYGGQVLSRSAGTVEGPSGKETYYNLDMSGVVSNARAAGIGGDYWVRSDGAKMMGDYIICACDVTGAVRNRYDIVETSLGTGICLDTGGFAAGNPSQIDIATSW